MKKSRAIKGTIIIIINQKVNYAAHLS
jgi:hypothetical protein